MIDLTSDDRSGPVSKPVSKAVRYPRQLQIQPASDPREALLSHRQSSSSAGDRSYSKASREDNNNKKIRAPVRQQSTGSRPRPCQGTSNHSRATEMSFLSDDRSSSPEWMDEVTPRSQATHPATMNMPQPTDQTRRSQSKEYHHQQLRNNEVDSLVNPNNSHRIERKASTTGRLGKDHLEKNSRRLLDRSMPPPSRPGRYQNLSQNRVETSSSCSASIRQQRSGSSQLSYQSHQYRGRGISQETASWATTSSRGSIQPQSQTSSCFPSSVPLDSPLQPLRGDTPARTATRESRAGSVRSTATTRPWGRDSDSGPVLDRQALVATVERGTRGSSLARLPSIFSSLEDEDRMDGWGAGTEARVRARITARQSSSRPARQPKWARTRGYCKWEPQETAYLVEQVTLNGPAWQLIYDINREQGGPIQLHRGPVDYKDKAWNYKKSQISYGNLLLFRSRAQD